MNVTTLRSLCGMSSVVCGQFSVCLVHPTQSGTKTANMFIRFDRIHERITDGIGRAYT